MCVGVLVQGVARLKFSSLKPLYQSHLEHSEVAVHWHYVNESMALFLFYFLQLTVMATYISQELVKLVPLLTIVFVFGRYGFSLFLFGVQDPNYVYTSSNIFRSALKLFHDDVAAQLNVFFPSSVRVCGVTVTLRRKKMK